MTIGDRIKQRRLELGLSVDELSKKLRKNRATIYRYENNEIENLPLSTLEPLAKALEVTPAYLMGWEDDIPDYDIFLELLATTNWSYSKFSYCDMNPNCPLTSDEKISKLIHETEPDACANCQYNKMYFYLYNGDKYYKFEEDEFDALTCCLKPYLLFRINEAISKKKGLTEYEYQMTEEGLMPVPDNYTPDDIQENTD